MENHPPLPPKPIKIKGMGPLLLAWHAGSAKHQSKNFENFTLTVVGLNVMYEVEAASLSF